MKSLPDINPWRDDIDPEMAEQEIRWLRERIAAADDAIAAQQRIIASDGYLSAYQLSLCSITASQKQLETKLAELMERRSIEVFEFALDGPLYSQHRARAQSLGEFLSAIQKLYVRIGQALSMSNPGNVIPTQIRNLCQLEVAGFYPSSFGVRFIAPTRSDLAGDSLTNTALEATFDLMNASHPLDLAATIGPRAMAQYRNLVNTLLHLEATPKVHWRTPAGEDREWCTDSTGLLELSNRLAKIHDFKPKTVECSGTLTGASLRRQKFEFTSDTGLVTGKAPREIADKVTKFFGSRCKITYSETLFIDETTEQEKHSRTLLDIKSV